MMNVSAATASDGTVETTSRHNGALVVAALLSFSVVVGVLAFWRFTTSERTLSAAMQEFHTKGAALTPEQCVDETMAFARRCEAMVSLCESTTPRLAEECMAAQDRSAWCASLGDAPKATSFGVPECKARKVDRYSKKACASAYRGVATHCARLRGQR